MVSKRIQAAEAYVQALRTGEASAAERADAFLAGDVVLVDGKAEFSGRDKVLQRITGWWPFTAKYRRGAWTAPREDGDGVTVTAELPPPGAGPASIAIRFTFDGVDLIRRVEQGGKPAPSETTDAIPDFVKGLVDSARMNNAPLTAAYTGENGEPVLSFRGSTQVYSPTQLSMWLRNPDGAMVRALAKNPRMALSYFDPVGNWFIFEGRARVASDPDVTRRVFQLLPEVERNHDPDCHGAALIVDVDHLEGSTAWGRVRMVRPT
ncbi:MAG: pyridoxamine 5'-phosphate oxidase family protein [Chloroflexota bacterium]